MERNKYQICEKLVYLRKAAEFNQNNFHAGGKAPSDVACIAKVNGYKELYIRILSSSSIIGKILRKFLLIDWIKLYFRIKRNSIVLIQPPIRWGNPSIRKILFQALRLTKGVIIVFLLHDVEPLRQKIYITEKKISKAKREFELTLKNSEFFIAHNYRMKEYLVS